MASHHWNESAQPWVEFVDGTDLNRDYVLDPAMLRLAGDVQGLEVLDVGCGEGRFCRMLDERGARTTGVDPTEKLLDVARERHSGGRYLDAGAELLPFEDASFDLVISYVTLCDVADYRAAISEMARVVRPGGRILYANLGPASSTSINGWTRDDSGSALFLPLDNYTFEWGAVVGWRGISVVNYHRPLCDYIQAFLEQGLRLTAFEEPIPTPKAIAANPRLAEYLRVRFFVVMEWAKE